MNTEEQCPRIEALSALTDGALRATERAAIEAHASGCAICAPVLVEMRQLRTRFAALPRPQFEFDLAAEVDRRIAPAPPSRAPAARPARRRWWQVALLAPGGALALTGGLWLGAALTPAAFAGPATPAVQMAAFSALPPGALCPALQGCGGAPR
jgi:anti-sigma factor RsiW